MPDQQRRAPDCENPSPIQRSAVRRGVVYESFGVRRFIAAFVGRALPRHVRGQSEAAKVVAGLKSGDQSPHSKTKSGNELRKRPAEHVLLAVVPRPSGSGPRAVSQFRNSVIVKVWRTICAQTTPFVTLLLPRRQGHGLVVPEGFFGVCRQSEHAASAGPLARPNSRVCRTVSGAR